MPNPNTNNLISGPGQFYLNSALQSHTEGGIKCKISPKNRGRMVDRYGQSSVDIVHQGDDVKVTVPFAEWSAAVLGIIYNPGLNSTTGGASGSGIRFIGIGRSGGYIYTPLPIQIVPFLAADNLKYAAFFRAVPIGDFEVDYDNEKDRILSVDWGCLVTDIANGGTDGELIGQLCLP